MTNLNEELYNKKIFNKSLFDIEESDIVLDIGCGGGENTYFFSNRSRLALGSDVKYNKNWELFTNKNLFFLLASIEHMPFKNNSITKIFVKDVLHHVNKIDVGLREMDRILKPFGKISIIEPNRYNPMMYIHMVKMGKHEHLSTYNFKYKVRKVFPSASYKSFECHVYPVKNYYILNMLTKVEKLIESIPILRNYQSYNIATFYKK